MSDIIKREESNAIISLNRLEFLMKVTDKILSKSISIKEQREALIAIYNACDGKNWRHQDNWCSDEPLDKWYGISTDEQGNVIRITLSFGYDGEDVRNRLNGSLPPEIGQLQNLTELDLGW